jgi:hypothetical protein
MARWPATKVKAMAAGELAAVAELVRGRGCDLRSVALDDEQGVLHVPMLDRSVAVPGRRAAAGQRRAAQVTAELVVRRIVEFSLEAATGTDWFDLDAIVYDEASQRLSIGSTSPLRFVLTVDDLDVSLRIRRTKPVPVPADG